MGLKENFGNNPVALVTGASSGIGLATARVLALHGFRVILAARRSDRLRQISSEIGPLAFPVVLDIQSPKDVNSFADSLPDDFRNVDVLINSAGHDLGGIAKFDAGSTEVLESIIETNVQGLIRLTHVVLRGMLSRRRGHIINIGSDLALRPRAQRSVYGASKAAVHAFSSTLRAELAGSGVRVSEIMPGLTRSEFALTRLHGDQSKADAFFADAGTPLEAEDVARAIIYVLSEPPGVTIEQLVMVSSERP
jgi:3-hydroxy acid dehydrogenase/malonic semialdehyde reductase